MAPNPGSIFDIGRELARLAGVAEFHIDLTTPMLRWRAEGRWVRFARPSAEELADFDSYSDRVLAPVAARWRATPPPCTETSIAR